MRPEILAFPAEIRAISEEGKPRKIIGQPAIYNMLSEDLGGFQERVLPGAFTKTLSESNYKSLWNHEDVYVLGSRKGGNLAIVDTQFGLSFEVQPPDTTWVRDLVLPSIERGDVDQMSFRFRMIQDRWIYEGDLVIRELLEVRLYEVSPVTFAAYPQTSVNLRSLIGPELDLLLESREKAARNQLTDKERSRITELVASLNGTHGPAPSDHPRDASGPVPSDHPQDSRSEETSLVDLSPYDARLARARCF